MSVPAQSSLPPLSPARIDFGWVGQAWELFKAQAGVWIGAVLLYFFLNLVIFAVLLIMSGGWAALQSSYAYQLRHPQPVLYHYPAPTALAYQKFAVGQFRNVLLAGANAVLAGGLYQMALRQKRGEPISVFGLFSALPQIMPLFLVGTVAPIATALIEAASLWPLHHFLPPVSTTLIQNIYLFLSTLISSVLLFAPLLVLDVHADVPGALLGSIRLLRGQLLRGVGFYLYASVVSIGGLLACCVGMLATYPVFILSITVGYLALTQPTGNMPEFDPAPVGVWPPPPRVF